MLEFHDKVQSAVMAIFRHQSHNSRFSFNLKKGKKRKTQSLLTSISIHLNVFKNKNHTGCTCHRNCLMKKQTTIIHKQYKFNMRFWILVNICRRISYTEDYVIHLIHEPQSQVWKKTAQNINKVPRQKSILKLYNLKIFGSCPK